MDFFVPKYRRDGNAKVESLYTGVSAGGTTVTTIQKPSLDGNRMEKTRTFGKILPRGRGGWVGHLILGGMETTLDEMEYLAAAKKERAFIPRTDPMDVVEMCRIIQARRNELIWAARKRLGIAEVPAKKIVLHLPVGHRMVPTNEPGFSILARTR